VVVKGNENAIILAKGNKMTRLQKEKGLEAMLKNKSVYRDRKRNHDNYSRRKRSFNNNDREETS